MKFDGLRLSKKYISSAKTLYTEDLLNITFNYLCENSPNDLCHFWSHKSFFMTQSIYMSLVQTLHTFHKSSLSKWKFSDLPLLILKFTKFLMSFLEPGVSFSSKFASFFSVIRLTLLYFLSKSVYALDKRIQSRCKFSDFRLLAWKLTKFLLSFFKPQISFPLNFQSVFSVIIHNSSEIF